MLQRLQLMLRPPAAVSEPSSQFADTDSQQLFLHDLTTSQHVLQPMDNLDGQYDDLSRDFITHPTTTAFDSNLADSEMVVAGTDVGLSEFGFSSLDVNMSEDGMPMPDLLSTLSTDIAHLLYN